MNPKFSEIGTKDTKKTKDLPVINDDPSHVRRLHSNALEERRREIESKITHLESKLAKHQLKEGMLDTIIATTYSELENLHEKEFTKRGQKQAILIKQLEALSILHDTILKYEDMIQKYHKILIDLENNKLNSFFKIMSLQKEEEKAEEGIADLLITLQNQIKTNNQTPMAESLLNEIEEELKANNY